MPEQTLTAKDNQTGRTVTFKWRGEHPPTDDDMAEVFQAAGNTPTVAPPIMTPTGPAGFSNLSDAPDRPDSTRAKVFDALDRHAMPRSGTDLVGTMMQGDAGNAVMNKVVAPAASAVAGTVGKYGGAAADFVTSFIPGQAKAKAALKVLSGLNPMEWNSPLTVAGREGRAAAAARQFNDLPLMQQMERLPTTGAAPVTRQAGAPFPQVPKVSINDLPLAQQMESLPTTGPTPMGRQADPPFRAPARSNFNERPISEQMDQLPNTPAPERGRLPGPPIRVTPPDAPPPLTRIPPPEAAAAAAPPGPWSPEELAFFKKNHYTAETIAKMQPPSAAPPADVPVPPPPPLQEARVQMGAERVGRAQGLTKEQVRAQTKPISGEDQDAASNLVPLDALHQMADALKLLPPGSPERAAYVARATSGKGKWTAETARRLLEHLGLVAPLGVGTGLAARDAMTTQMDDQ